MNYIFKLVLRENRIRTVSREKCVHSVLNKLLRSVDRRGSIRRRRLMIMRARGSARGTRSLREILLRERARSPRAV